MARHTAIATPLNIANATVTKVQVYSTTDCTANFWIQLNGNTRVGPNPGYAGNTCELWSRDKQIYAAVLAALMSGKKVDVAYEDQGGGGYYCYAVNFAISN